MLQNQENCVTFELKRRNIECESWRYKRTQSTSYLVAGNQLVKQK